MRELARLAASTELMVGDVIGVAMIKLDVSARLMATKLGQDVTSWPMSTLQEVEGQRTRRRRRVCPVSCVSGSKTVGLSGPRNRHVELAVRSGIHWDRLMASPWSASPWRGRRPSTRVSVVSFNSLLAQTGAPNGGPSVNPDMYTELP